MLLLVGGYEVQPLRLYLVQEGSSVTYHLLGEVGAFEQVSLLAALIWVIKSIMLVEVAIGCLGQGRSHVVLAYATRHDLEASIGL